MASGKADLLLSLECRATFEYGDERAERDPPFVWRRIGGHIFGRS
jgi:hypothetical protein